MKREYKFLKPFMLVAIGAAVSYGATYFYYRDKIDFAERYALVAECEDIIKKAEVKMPSDEAISEKLAEGFAESFHDKYTVYKDNNTDRDKLAAYFNNFPTASGGGFAIAFSDDDELFFETVEPGSYAEKNGIAQGDVIASINGLATSGSDYKNMRELFGKEGTTCQLVLRRGDETIELEYVRHNEKASDAENMTFQHYGDTLYISMDRAEKFMSTEFVSENFGSVVIDLRDNKGGSTGTALNFADLFLGEGYITEHYYTGEDKVYKLSKSEDDINVPMVVLVNENTASAAEIMTGLLKQFGGAVVVGTNTFGKGIFQLEEQLSNGGYLHYTAGTFTVGDWECWHGKGIAPDIEVEMDSSLIGTDEDIQLQKALELLG